MDHGVKFSYKMLWAAINNHGDNSEIVKLLVLGGAKWPHSLLGKDYRKRYPNLFRWCTIAQFPYLAHLLPDEGPNYVEHEYRPPRYNHYHHDDDSD